MASVIRGSDDFDSGSVGASTTYGDVGTYALMYFESHGQHAPGVTKAGSSLYPSNTYAGYYTNNGSYSGSGHPSGTWRIMGQIGYYNGSTALSRGDMSSTVFVRIS